MRSSLILPGLRPFVLDSAFLYRLLLSTADALLWRCLGFELALLDDDRVGKLPEKLGDLVCKERVPPGVMGLSSERASPK